MTKIPATTSRSTGAHAGRTISRRTARTASVMTGAVLAAAAIVVPSGVTEAAYNVGVASVNLDPAIENCEPGQALPCTSGAGAGQSNIVRVTQSKVNGYHTFNGIQGSGQSPNFVWFGADVSAECKFGHHVTRVLVDDDLGLTDLDGLRNPVNTWGLGEGGWPHVLKGAEGKPKTMPTRRVALNMPLGAVIDQQFGGSAGMFTYGENVIAERVSDGMTYAEARAIPFEYHTSVQVGVEAHCKYNGLMQVEYFKREYRNMPLTIQFMPVEVGPAAGAGQLEPTGDLSYAAQVTDVNLIVLPDPADPCVLHLSGTIQTNQATPVEYRWVNPHGQRSNTYSIGIDHLQVAYLHETVAIPQLVDPDFTDDLVVVEGPGEIGGWAAPESAAGYSGTYKLEVLSPNFKSAADGFSVEYCPGPAPSGQRTPVGESTVGELTIGDPPPTHDEAILGLRG